MANNLGANATYLVQGIKVSDAQNGMSSRVIADRIVQLFTGGKKPDATIECCGAASRYIQAN